MLLPDCKCCSGFFAVICLLPFSLLLLPPLFPSCPAAVPAVVLSAVSAGLALFPWLFPPLLCRFLRRTSRAVPCALSRPGQHPGSPRSGHALGVIRKAAAKLRCSGLVAVTCLLCRIRPGNPAGIVARKILRGACPAYFAWAPVIPAWFGCRGGQAWTSTGYGFGRKRVSAPYFPTGALRSRLFSKGILPAATVFCTRNCGGRNPASSW